MTDRQTDDDRLDKAEKEFLKDIAGLAVAAAVRNEPPPDVGLLAGERGLDLSGRLSQSRGAFVTLTLDGQLRGCIGYIQGVKPLVEAVVDNGRSASVGDPRFAPVTELELAKLELEISALTPLRSVNGPGDIKVGVHGILLTKNGRQSVFLPQVAPEQGWDLDTTLTQLALKAGLAPDAWASGAEFQVFEAEVF
ncbi:MAG: AmmeMemoRadiSam system protein A [Gemmatimonadales bacterium]|nr:AmmeMemoRadiSam system protein A [Gemmatimonadales bacterium]